MVAYWRLFILSVVFFFVLEAIYCLKSTYRKTTLRNYVNYKTKDLSKWKRTYYVKNLYR